MDSNDKVNKMINMLGLGMVSSFELNLRDATGHGLYEIVQLKNNSFIKTNKQNKGQSVRYTSIKQKQIQRKEKGQH